MSKSGIETKAGYLCFTNIGEERGGKPQHDFGNFNIDKVPIDLIKEKIKLTLLGIDKDVIEMHLEAERKEYERNLLEARAASK